MRVLLYGETERKGSGAWCYLQVLREMGHSVAAISEFDGMEQYRKSLYAKVIRKLCGGIPERDRRRHAHAVVKLTQEHRPDLVIILKGLHLGPEDIQTIKRLGAWVININHDDFFSRNKHNWSHHQREAIPSYDFIFTTREVNVSEIAPMNRAVEWFPFSYYPKIHRPILDPEWESDVVFVGTWETDRSKQLELLVRQVPCRYAIYGAQWDRLDRKSHLRQFVHPYEIVMDDLAKAITNAKVALGFLRKENRDDYTQRTFEIPACGGVLLAERTRRHCAYYREGEEAEFFESGGGDELAEKIKLLLKCDTRNQEIRIAGQRAVVAGKHTYRDRLERLFELYADR
jgi:hypothetical protein